MPKPPIDVSTDTSTEPARSRTMHIAADLAELGNVRSMVREIAERAAISEQRRFDMQVAVSEAVANAIEHAESEVEIEAWSLPDRILFEITNDGYFRPGSHKESGDRRRGLGMPLMATLSDHMHFARLSGNKTRVSLTFLLRSRSYDSQGSGAPLVATPRRRSARQWRLPGGLLTWSWVPVALLAAAMVVVGALDVNARYQSMALIASLNTFFCAGSGVAIAYVAGRTYVVKRAHSALTLGTGALIFGFDYWAGGLLIGLPNYSISVHLAAMPVAAALFILTVFWSRRNAVVPGGGWNAHRHLIYYGLGLCYVVVLVVLSVTGVLPAVFGGDFKFTVFGKVVIALGCFELFFAAAGFLVLNRRKPGRFFIWCAGAMALAGLGFIALFGMVATGKLLGWMGVSAQYLGGVYLLLAALSVERIGEDEVLPLGQALRETQARLQALIEVSPNAIWLQMERKVLFANPPAVELLGAESESAVLGRNVISLVPAQSREEFADWMDSVFSGQRTAPHYQTFETGYGGAPIETEVVGTRVELEQGPGLMLIAHDIRDLKRVERVLRESEENFHALADNIPQLAWMADATGRISWLNRRWYEFTGSVPGERTWDSDWKQASHPDHYDKIAESMRNAFETGEPWEATFPLRAADGSYRWFLSRAMPIRDDTGKVSRWFGTNTDITESLELQRDAEKHARFYSTLTEVDREIHSSLDAEQIAQSALASGATALSADSGVLEMRAADGSTVFQSYGWKPEGEGFPSDVAPGYGSLIAASGETTVLDRVEDVELPPGERNPKWPVKSLIAAPLIIRETVTGSLSFAYRSEHHFRQEEVEFVEKLASSLTLAIENARLYESQRNIAATLQRRLLDVPEQVPGVQFSQLYRSATEEAAVGGDFYDVIQLENGGVGIVIGDVSGHGVEAARTATLVRDTVGAFAGAYGEPEDVLSRTNQILLRKGIAGFVTVLLAILGPDGRRLRFCSAGHPNILVSRRNGETFRVGEKNSTPLGIFPDWLCHVDEVQLEAGDLLLFHTDGLSEARRGSELYGEERLVERLRAVASEPLPRVPQMILEEVLRFSGGTLRDDVAMLAVRPLLDDSD